MIKPMKHHSGLNLQKFLFNPIDSLKRIIDWNHDEKLMRALIRELELIYRIWALIKQIPNVL